MARPVTVVGPYTNGEIPFPLKVQFEPEPVDLTGYTLAVRIENGVGDERTFTGSVTWDDAATGRATVSWGAGDVDLTDPTTDEERFSMQVWAVGPQNKIATSLIMWTTYRNVGSVP